ncbi:MAG TPA: sensor histidine kinase [Anaerolineales bacterium]|nr:sensor histidine kinase [Anaerolineales bacterium]
MTAEAQTTLTAPLDLQAELAEAQKSEREISLMIEQSQNEVAKLAQRNASITAHLQQVQSKVDQVPSVEVKMAYDAALDAQQRLFVMRGQLEKLQSDKAHLEKFRAALERLGQDDGNQASGQSSKPKGTVAEIEMVVNAQEAERQRLSRQMHDGPAQAMSNFILQTEIAMRLLDADPKKAKEELASLKGSALGTFEKLRNFIFELRPMMLDDLGLAPTIRKYVEAFKEQTSLEAALTVTGTERRLEPYLEIMIFRAVQELLGNAARHSQAAGVKVQLDMGNDAIRVSVEDNGRGFDAEAAQASTTLGLRLIRERVEMLGGNLSVDSAVGKGARILFTVPVHS